MTRILLSIYLLTLTINVMAFESFIIKDIRIDGLQRISAGTVFSYLPVKVNEEFNNQKSVQSIKALFKTGFFKDVELKQEDQILVVELVERPSIAKIDITGNKDIESEELLAGLKNIGLAEGRVFNRSLLDKVEQELRRQYFSNGKYGVKIESSVSPLERNRVAVFLTVSEGKISKIREINIIGNKVFSNSTLRKLFILDTPSTFSFYTGNDKYSKQKLSADLEVLRSHYLDQGYLNFKIKSTQVSISADKKNIYITININEGAQFKIKELKLAGTLIVPEILIKQFSISPGEVFSQKRVSKTVKKLSQRLGDEGYAFANVNTVPNVNEKTKEVTLTFFIDPGKRVYVRRVNMSGNIKTSDIVLRREMRQMEGGWFSTKQVNRSKTRLNRLGYFEDVRVETPVVPGASDQVDVNYTVKERPSGNFLASVGYSQTGGVILSGSINQDNFLGTGKRVGISANNSTINTGYSLNYYNPYYTRDGVSRGFSLSSQRTDASQANLANYLTDVDQISMTYGVPLNENDRINFNVAYATTELKATSLSFPEVTNFIVDNGGNALDTSINFDTLTLGGGWSHDTRDKAVYPTKGVYQNLAAEVTLPGGDLEFYKISYKQQRYIKFSKNLSLLLRGEIAYGDGYGDTNGLPFFKNFFAGGVKSVRGYYANSLGPKSPAVTGRPIGGNLKTVGAIEMLFPPPFAADSQSVRMSAFFDAGYVFPGIDNFSINQLRGSVGVSMQWLSPVGPLTFSIASPINDRETDRTQSFQFSLGGAL
ncbi:MAG: outer membrane protein assembly factor BamA [Gammaproteobacteria bacterium]|nr:outer membrane protein assembly factor BamA [Gammaproteobacteria bacterium]